MILKLISFFLPWRLRRIYLQKVFGYRIHTTAKIGFSWVFPQYLEMNANSYISHLTVVVHLNRLYMGENSIIDRGNWITGFPLGAKTLHFKHKKDRKPELIIGSDSAITKKHHIDCTDQIKIGKFVTIAGYNSQLLTHSINIHKGIQDCMPIEIGDYTFIGTNCIILGGASLPAYSVLGANSLLNKKFEQEWMLYAGSPARLIASINKEAKYFYRKVGVIE